ncbi:MAG: ATPase, partial [Rhodospirillales bacterium]|nr:ATPase [Rhodospirillales bacterium]
SSILENIFEGHLIVPLELHPPGETRENLSPYHLGEAILGGPMQTRTEVAKTTAEVAVRILDGEKAGDIKTPPLPLSPPKYDWRLMQRFGISESDLPPGSTVFYKPPSPWETYRWPILSALTVLLFQAGLITLLLLERHRRQTAEMDSRQRMVELAHVNRFSTAGEMAASIAHEINQPLGAILNNTETAKIMLKSQYPNLNEMGEIVDDIQRDNSRATEVIGRLRNFMKKAPFERKNFDLNDQVAETVKFLSPEARSRDIALRSKPNGAPLPINGDPIQLQQVLSNLILNALDATSDTSEPEKAVTVATTRTGNFAEVSIADTGPGVSPEAAKKIFDPFFSTKDHGMGMGLSIVRTIVETHNGRIEVDNRNGEKGAVFRVKLPLA